MEQQMDRLKVKNYQHARIIKEGDEEMWISSEDLRTEGSSDEDTLKKLENLNSKKNKKQKRNKTDHAVLNIQGSPKKHSINTQLFGTSNKSGVGMSLTPAEINEPSTSKILNITKPNCEIDLMGKSSQLDREALNLESQWRPKRGSLKLPTLIAEGMSVEV